MTAAVAAYWLSQAPARLRAEIIAAETATLADVKRQAVRQSSGPYTARQLAAAGHPFARRAPNPSYDAAVLNVQTGRVRAGWRTRGPQATTAGIVSRTFNVADEAQYLEQGNRFTVGRPVPDAVEKKTAPPRLRRLKLAIKRALTP